jgi:hypothetical protein
MPILVEKRYGMFAQRGLFWVIGRHNAAPGAILMGWLRACITSDLFTSQPIREEQ